jgi:ATP-GRASP peptide maturase of grasp-with-spasm system
MILIISSAEDKSTNDVIDWLLYFKKSFLRVSEDRVIETFRFSSSEADFCFTVNSIKYRLKQFSAAWYRRSGIRFKTLFFDGNDELTSSLNRQLNSEIITISSLFYKLLENKSLNNYKDLFINKLLVIEECKKIGIHTPEGIITTQRTDVIKFVEKNQRIITKNMSAGVFVFHENRVLNTLTNEVKISDLNAMPDTFFPMYFQKLVQKSFEIRCFYLDGEFFCSAIFSQNDGQTELDFRNYNFDKPNRTPPYKLEKIIEMKLDKLMINLNLKSGSIDLIVDEYGNYIFLEVNPIGQFSQVSIPCNYFIEKRIAEYLTK